MNLITFAKRRAAWIGALGALFAQMPAHAGLCTLTDTGTTEAAILTTVNPKPFTVPPPATCLVNGLPGVGSDLPGYILKFSRTADIKANNVKVGNLYDRVYCLGTGTTCNATNTYIIATRVQMIGVGTTTACPLWNGASAGCFEINDIFRTTRTGTGAAGVQVGYWLGASTGAAPTSPVAVKYLERTGRTLSGLNQTITRNNGKVAFRTDVNFDDPDGVDSPWSPWLLYKQTCTSVITDMANATAKFSVRLRQGGEEGQSQTYVEQAGYVCTP